MKAIATGMLGLLASGCAAWGPTWSEVTGARYQHVIMDRHPAIIEKIDGNSAYPTNPIKLEPGRHEIVMQGRKLNWPGGTQPHTTTFDLQPCMRYYLNAQFDNPVSPNWTPVVDYVEPIAGCKIAAKAAG